MNGVKPELSQELVEITGFEVKENYMDWNFEEDKSYRVFILEIKRSRLFRTLFFCIMNPIRINVFPRKGDFGCQKKKQSKLKSGDISPL